jgi:hypothetical protein
LSRIHLPRLGQRHQRVALVIAEFRVGTRPDQNRKDVRFRQDGADGLLQTEFDLFVRKHGKNLTAKNAKYTKETKTLL